MNSVSVEDVVDSACRDIDSGADVNAVTATFLYQVPMSSVTEEMYYVAKFYNMAVYRAICRTQG